MISEPPYDIVDVRVLLAWEQSVTVALDDRGKLAFGELPDVAGLYRLTLTGGRLSRPMIYIGQTSSMRRRLARNYRNPSSGQQTALRINGMLLGHLAAGGHIALAVATKAAFWIAGEPADTDLAAPAARKTAERAAIAVAGLTGDVDVANLD